MSISTSEATDQSAVKARRYGKTTSGEGAEYWFYGDRVVLRSPDGAMPIIIEHHVGAGGAAPLHMHRKLDDSFYMLAGTLALRCGDDTFVASSGDYVSLPMGVPHTLRVLGTDEVVMLHTHTDPSFLNFIKEVGVPASQAKPDMASMDFAAMNEIAGETGQPVLGPPMTIEEADRIARAAGVDLGAS